LVVLRLAQVEVPGFQGINVAVVEQFVNVVQVAHCKALGNASNLLRRYSSRV